jgi:hypothetical protein
MDQRPPKNTVTFPENEEYLQRIQAAKQQQVPLGGAPMPKMPRFDQQPEQDRWQGVQNQTPQQMIKGIIPPEKIEELKRMGKFIPGAGSNLAVNQPAYQQMLAEQQQDPNQVQAPPGGFANPPRPEGSGLRPETVKQIEAVAKANDPNVKPAVEADAEKPAVDKVTEELAKFEEEYDYDEEGNRVNTILVNRARREAIESRCGEIDLEQLLFNQEVRQRVPIIPGKLEPTFRSVSTNEDLYTKRKMAGLEGSRQYIMDTFGLMNLTCGLYSINGREIPTHLDKDGVPDDKLFEVKMKFLMKFPIQVISDLSANYAWFNRRVSKLLVIDKVKGF